jgi:hypothetical protein
MATSISTAVRTSSSIEMKLPEMKMFDPSREYVQFEMFVAVQTEVVSVMTPCSESYTVS